MNFIIGSVAEGQMKKMAFNLQQNEENEIEHIILRYLLVL